MRVTRPCAWGILMLCVALMTSVIANASPTPPVTDQGNAADVLVERPVPVGERLVIGFLPSDSGMEVVVVEPRIAVRLDGLSEAEGVSYANNIHALLQRIKTRPSGAQAVEAAKMKPLPDLAGSGGPYLFNDRTGRAVDIHVVITADRQPSGMPYAATPLNNTRARDGSGSPSLINFDLASQVPQSHDELGRGLILSDDTALLHELVHAIRNLGGFAVDLSRSADVHLQNIYQDNAPLSVATRVEELRTLGTYNSLAAANGVSPYGTQVLGDPDQLASVSKAASALHMIDVAPNLTPALKAELHRGVVEAFGYRRGFSATEYSYSAEAGYRVRGTYHYLPGESIEAYDVIADRLSLTAADLDEPGNSTKLRKTEKMEGVEACIAHFLTCGAATPGPEPTKTQMEAATRLKNAVRAGRVGLRSPTSEFHSGRMMFTDDELAQLARIYVADMELTGGRSFTSDLQEAARNPKTFQPLGGATTAGAKLAGALSPKLTEAWSTLNSAATPLMVALWISSVAEAFSADASNLTKATAMLSIVPVVGQLMGIADSTVKGDAGGLASNLLALLAVSAAFLEIPVADIIFGIASLIAVAVAAIVGAITGSSDVDRMITRRDEAWHNVLGQQTVDKFIPRWLASAQKAYEVTRQNLLWGALLTIATVDAKTAGSRDSAVKAAAQTAKARIVADTAASEEVLRSGFIDGVHRSVTAAIEALNRGEGSDEFSRAYLTKVERPAYVEEHYERYCIWHHARNHSDCTNEPDARAEAGERFDSEIVPSVVKNVPSGRFTPADLKSYQQRVDDKINADRMFPVRRIFDTTPVAPVGFTYCVGIGQLCKPAGAGTDQVVFGAAGHYVTAPLPTSGLTCTAASFVVDPNPAADKMCFVPATDNRADAATMNGNRLPAVRTCANDGETCAVTGTQLVAYGSGAAWVIKPVTDRIDCGSGSFSVDPAPNATKTCVVLAGSAPGTSPQTGTPSGFCADKGDYCHVSGHATLAYGPANNPKVWAFHDHWTYREVNGADYPNGVPCTAGTGATFPREPVPGEDAACYLTRPSESFHYCAGPGGKCSVPEGALLEMAYGGDGAWVVKSVSGGEYACIDDTFEDVTYGRVTYMTNAHNYCYLSASNADVVLGETRYDELNNGDNYWALGTQEGTSTKIASDRGSTLWAFGGYDGRSTAAYYIKPLIGVDEKRCRWSEFTSMEPYFHFGGKLAHCFQLRAPRLSFDSTQKTFRYLPPIAAPSVPPSVLSATPPSVPAITMPSAPSAAVSGGRRIKSTAGDCLVVNTDHRYVGIAECGTSPAHPWQAEADGRLRNADRCLSIADHSAGALVLVETCDGSTDQTWKMDDDKLINMGTGRCLAVPGRRTKSVTTTPRSLCGTARILISRDGNGTRAQAADTERPLVNGQGEAPARMFPGGRLVLRRGAVAGERVVGDARSD